MFDYGKWVRDGLVSGYGSGEFSGPRVVTLTAGYVANGTLTQDDAAVIAASHGADRRGQGRARRGYRAAGYPGRRNISGLIRRM